MEAKKVHTRSVREARLRNKAVVGGAKMIALI